LHSSHATLGMLESQIKLSPNAMKQVSIWVNLHQRMHKKIMMPLKNGKTLQLCNLLRQRLTSLMVWWILWNAQFVKLLQVDLKRLCQQKINWKNIWVKICTSHM
jgi:hypothetical protein